MSEDSWDLGQVEEEEPGPSTSSASTRDGDGTSASSEQASEAAKPLPPTEDVSWVPEGWLPWLQRFVVCGGPRFIRDTLGDVDNEEGVRPWGLSEPSPAEAMGLLVTTWT